MSCFCWRNTPYLKVKDILCSHRSGYAQLTRNAKYSQKEAILTLFFSKASEKLWSIYNGLAQFSSVQSLSYVRLFVTPMDCSMPGLPVHHQFPSLLKLTPIELVMHSNHFILCYPLLLPPSIFPSIRVFSNESALHTRWPKSWSFSFNISPSNEYSGLISFRKDCLVLLALQVTLQKSSPTL